MPRPRGFRAGQVLFSYRRRRGGAYSFSQLHSFDPCLIPDNSSSGTANVQLVLDDSRDRPLQLVCDLPFLR